MTLEFEIAQLFSDSFAELNILYRGANMVEGREPLI
jgi:hypothetical protein